MLVLFVLLEKCIILEYGLIGALCIYNIVPYLDCTYLQIRRGIRKIFIITS